MPHSRQEAPAGAMQDLLDYARAQGTTGLRVIQDGEVLVRADWPATDEAFAAAFVHGAGPDGALLEDVASQQKSFVAVLAAIAADKRLIDFEDPVSRHLGAGWSRAAPDQEAAIRIVDVLTMTSGLDVRFACAGPPGAAFVYNTPVYAVTKRVLEAASGRGLEALTRAWLTAPAGMTQTDWRLRPAALGDVGNPTGLVTTPDDVAVFGRMVLDRGLAPNGRRVVSEEALAALFAPTPANPAYGRLWWLNGGPWAMRVTGERVEGPLIPSAPADVRAALGAMDRKLYVSPGLRLVVVRLGQAAPDKAFDDALWRKLAPILR